MNRLIEELEINLWTNTLMLEQESSRPRKQVIADSAMKAILHTLSLRTWQITPLLDDGNAQYRAVLDKEKKEAIARELYEKKDVDKLQDFLNVLNYEMNVNSIKTSEQLSDRHQAMIRNEELASSTFLILYIVGSILIWCSYFEKRNRPDFVIKSSPARRKKKAKRP